MKKTYINPVMETITIQLHQMLANSTPEVGKTQYTGGTPEARDFDFDDEEY